MWPVTALCPFIQFSCDLECRSEIPYMIYGGSLSTTDSQSRVWSEQKLTDSFYEYLIPYDRDYIGEKEANFHSFLWNQFYGYFDPWKGNRRTF